jgi:hypothetical protein
MNKTIAFVIGFILLAGATRAQETKLQTHTVAVNLLAIKDQLNSGLVFRGPGLGYDYSAQWQNEKRIMSYEGRFCFSAPMSKGIVGMSLNLVPVRFDYMFKAGPDAKVHVGPYAIAEYNYETYSDLHSGHAFWFSHYSLGLAISDWFRAKKSRIDLSLHATALGLTSRSPELDDIYFFDEGLGVMMGNLHQDMQFGSWDRYLQAEFEARWTPKEDSRLAYAWSFQYYGYFKEPTLTMMNNTLKLIFLPKKNK